MNVDPTGANLYPASHQTYAAIGAKLIWQLGLTTNARSQLWLPSQLLEYCQQYPGHSRRTNHLISIMPKARACSYDKETG
jgi:hypothetical protein